MSDLRKKLIRLAYQNPDLREDLMPLLKQSARNEFAVEGDDFGLVYHRYYRDDLVLYWPLENIGRRGKRVNVRDVSVQGDRIAWGATFVDRVKKVRTAAQANRLLDALIAEIKKEGEDNGNHVWYDRTDQVKGVDKSIPTPSMNKIEDIKGSDITVDMNSKPIRIYSQEEARELQESRMVYRFEVHQRFRKKLHMLRDELAAARGLGQVEQILKANRIKYDYNTYMDPMWV